MVSRLTVLGCSGGIAQNLRTTSLLLDDDILIDAGTGVADLSLNALAKIDNIFLTHSHLDHIVSLPFLLDSVGAGRTYPVTVYALTETIEILKSHIFNNSIWPDFSRIPSPQQPFVAFRAISVGEHIDLKSRRITALPANHTVPAVGYTITCNESTIAFSGDSGPCERFWLALNDAPNLTHLILETSFTNEDQYLADLSRHYCPATLADAIMALRQRPEIWISHLKPGQAQQIMAQLTTDEGMRKQHPTALSVGQILSF